MCVCVCVSLAESLCGSLYSVTYVGDNGTKSYLARSQGLFLLYFNLELGGGGAQRDGLCVCVCEREREREPKYEVGERAVTAEL